VWYAAKGYGSEEATQANARIAVLGTLISITWKLFQAEWARVMKHIASAGSRDVPEAAMQLLNMAHDTR